MLSQYTWSRSAWKKWVYWHGIERQTVRGAARIHATSSVEAHDCRLSGVTAPIAVIPLGIDSSAFASPPQPHWLRAKLKDQIDNEPIVLFLSRVHPKKGIVDFLLPAFAKLTIPAHLVILGGVDDSTPRHGVEILVASHRLGIADRVSQLGAVPPAERWSAYDGAAVFCLPSRSENFGIVVTEAMARGCPVVVSDAVDASEHVERAGAGLRVLLNVDALTQALEAVLTHPADAGTRGREYVRQHLCWDSLGPALAALYTEVPT
jgi:glycosyltransferase involved in cell wall biosynthesis